MSNQGKAGLLFDIDNALLDNDRVTTDLNPHLLKAFALKNETHDWKIFGERHTELEHADHPGILQR